MKVKITCGTKAWFDANRLFGRVKVTDAEPVSHPIFHGDSFHNPEVDIVLDRSIKDTFYRIEILKSKR